MKHFFMNGYLWHLLYVRPHSDVLIDRTGVKRVATTDPSTRCIYISEGLDSEFLRRVLIHELVHCTLSSYGIVEDVHHFSYPDSWIEAEEWICNFIADYGGSIFEIANGLLGR